MSTNVIRTYDNVFLNSKSLVIEYHDVIKCPFFILFLSLIKNEEFQNIFDISEFIDKSNDELFYFYITRKDENLLKNLKIKEGIFESVFKSDINKFVDWLNYFMYEEINMFKEFTDVELELNFVNVLRNLINTKMIKDIYIFTEKESKTIKEDIDYLFNNSAKYVYGDLKDIILENDIPNDSTYVFSNIKNILLLDQINKLNLSSILIADKFGYNYKDDEETPIIDLEKLFEKNTFKISFFNNILK